MGEYEFYGSEGFTQNSLQDRRYAFFGGPPGSINDLRRAWYATQLGLTNSALSVNDLEFRYYQSLGGVGSLQDMRGQYWSGTIAPNPSEPGLVARFNFNDPGDVETFDSVANRRMALTSFQKTAGYEGQAINALAGASVGDTADGFLNRSAFSVAVRAYLPATDVTTPGGGVRFYAADGTTTILTLLTRIAVTTAANMAVVATGRFGGTNISAGKLSGTTPTDAGLVADTWPWTFLIYDGALLQAFVNNFPVNAGVAASGLIDQPASMQAYVSATSAKIDDIRVFDYAISEAKRLELIGE